MSRRLICGIAVAVSMATLSWGVVSAQVAATDHEVTVGSDDLYFSHNKQNEPGLAVNPVQTNVLVAGANDNIDMERCNAGNPLTCPFTPGVGVSGVQFSLDGGTTWTQPTYTGWSARNPSCRPTPPATTPACVPNVGPIGTLPWYLEAGLVSNGDPELAFGPKPAANGTFSWANGPRLYYANIATKFDPNAFNGDAAIAVSRTDDVVAAAAGGVAGKAAWMPPVIVTKQNGGLFSDKEQIWADNASSSRFFGTVYVCWAAFQGQEKSPNAAPAGLQVAVSRDGGSTWKQHPIGSAANNGQKNPLDGCTVRTDSDGAAYVFGIGTKSQSSHQPFELMSKSTNGGTSWSSPVAVAGPVSQPGVFDPAQGRPTIDSVAGARSDIAPAPSVDIANGAPSGTDATDRIVMSYVSGTLVQPHVYFTESADHGTSWSAPRAIEAAGDRGFYTAPAISPNGTDVYVVYNAFTTPYHDDTSSPNMLVGVVKHADVGGSGTGAFSELHRGTPGDARGSSANALSAEFLGDYVYAAATRTYGAAVWNDARNAADCPAIDAWRESLITGGTVARPAPQQQCPSNFGNSDIFGGTYADPTP
jgi:hypothetical protein